MSAPKPIDLASYVEAHDGTWTVRGGGNVRDWNNIRYKVGLSGKNVPAQKLSTSRWTLSPWTATTGVSGTIESDTFSPDLHDALRATPGNAARKRHQSSGRTPR